MRNKKKRVEVGGRPELSACFCGTKKNNSEAGSLMEDARERVFAILWQAADNIGGEMLRWFIPRRLYRTFVL